MMSQVNAGRVRFVGRGEYNNSTQYYVFDLVSYNGNSYYAKVDTIGNLPTDTTYWQLVAEKGNVGPTGLTGNGISSIEKTSTSGLVDTYTITYTNGNTTTFDVFNGNGIDRIEKTATVGNKDTYTIYFTNGSTTTYEVSNGEVTREELEEEVERLSMIYNAFPSTTGEVEEGSINGTAEVPFKEISLKGNTSQNGEPTPDAPIPVNVVTGDNEVKIEGKNFLNVPSDYSVTGNTVIYITLPAGTYHISCGNVVKGGANAPAFTGFGTWFYLDTNTDVTRTLNETTQLTIRIYSNGYNAQDSTGVTSTINNLMISTSGGDYEPYQSQTYPINLGSMELCKIGDYQDYLYKESDKWCKYGAIGKVVLDGTKGTITTTTYSAGAYFHNIINIGLNGTNNDYALSNYYTYSSSYMNNTCKTANGGKGLVTRDNFDQSTYITWLGTNKPIFYYLLATPTTTEITDTTLIEQLDNLEKAYSYDTQTNISQTNQDKPFIISYEAILSLRNVLNS